MHEELYYIFEREGFDRFAAERNPERLVQEVMADRSELTCLAKVRLRTKWESGKWDFVASRALPQGFQDLRELDNNLSSILYVGTHAHSNEARVTDITNYGPLEGMGFSSWLIDKALESFLRVSGPDPWISGKLTAQDKDNPRRVPFWQRHVDASVSVNAGGKGVFCGPWKRGYNDVLRKFSALLVDTTGEPITREPEHGYGLYELNGRPALKMLSLYESMSKGLSWKPIWSTSEPGK